jgi:CDP-6-deoxy-D-xylo-4-hexulose-3-dehydrase
MRDWGRDCWCPSGKDNTCNARFKQKHGSLPFGYDHKYIYSHFGFNLKATDLQASIGVAQLKKLDAFTSLRRENWQRLYDGLKHLEDIFILPQATAGSEPSWFGFILTIRKDMPFKRVDLTSYLEQNNIQTRTLFSGNLLAHPAFDALRQEENSYRVIHPLEQTDLVLNNTFWIGVYPGLNKFDIEYMIDNINQFCKNFSN